MQIINLTQHPATPEQRAAGVVDLSPEGRETISRLLTFADIPEGAEVRVRAGMLAQIAAGDSRRLPRRHDRWCALFNAPAGGRAAHSRHHADVCIFSARV
jgi:hypothetical protein